MAIDPVLRWSRSSGLDAFFFASFFVLFFLVCFCASCSHKIPGSSATLLPGFDNSLARSCLTRPPSEGGFSAVLVWRAGEEMCARGEVLRPLFFFILVKDGALDVTSTAEPPCAIARAKAVVSCFSGRSALSARGIPADGDGQGPRHRVVPLIALRPEALPRAASQRVFVTESSRPQRASSGFAGAGPPRREIVSQRSPLEVHRPPKRPVSHLTPAVRYPFGSLHP